MASNWWAPDAGGLTHGELLAALEDRGWKQLPGSGLFSWKYVTPEGLEKRRNKQRIVLGVDFVHENGLLSFLKSQGERDSGLRCRRGGLWSLTVGPSRLWTGILTELIREKRQARAKEVVAKQASTPAKATTQPSSSPTPIGPDSSAVGTSPHAARPLFYARRSGPPPARDAAEQRTSGSMTESSGDESSSDESEVDAVPEARKSTGKPKPRPRLTTSKARKEQQAKTKAASRKPPKPVEKKTMNGRKRKAPSSTASDENSVKQIDMRLAQRQKELATLEAKLDKLQERVTRKRYEVSKLWIERDCCVERQQKLRALEEQHFGLVVKKEPAWKQEEDDETQTEPLWLPDEDESQLAHIC